MRKDSIDRRILQLSIITWPDSRIDDLVTIAGTEEWECIGWSWVDKKQTIRRLVFEKLRERGYDARLPKTWVEAGVES